jgi:hypothetical protein
MFTKAGCNKCVILPIATSCANSSPTISRKNTGTCKLYKPGILSPIQPTINHYINDFHDNWLIILNLDKWCQRQQKPGGSMQNIIWGISFETSTNEFNISQIREPHCSCRILSHCDRERQSPPYFFCIR